ncbi:Consortin, partial [Varanus komodoensis]
LRNNPGFGPEKEYHLKKSQRSESFQPESYHTLKEKASLQLTVGKDRMEEERCSDESTLELPTQSTGTLGTPCSGCLSSRDASKDDSLQQKGQFSEDVAKIEATVEVFTAKSSTQLMVDTLILTDADYIPPDLISSDENVQSGRNFLRSKHCSGSVAISGSLLGSSILSQQQQQQPNYGNGRKSVQDKTSGVSGNVQSESNVSEEARDAYKRIQEEAAVLEEECESEEPEDFFVQFLKESIKGREESLKFLESQGHSESLPTEQALYSSLESYSLDESFSSLDELAKRIEIAETIPAEGLVSILKKRDDSEGKTLAQIQQKQSKRRVRFQEMEDTLDQEEVGGGSCVLLILLCIATVFLSIGGTALYCTLGDAESPVCTDFSANVDFYYTRILQGIEELKHWISFS